MEKNQKKMFVIGILMTYLIISIVGLILIMPSAQNAFHQIFKYNDELVLMLAFICITFIILIPIYILFIVIRMDNNKKTENYKSEIDKDRVYIEGQLHELNDRLSSTADRWAEINHLLLDVQNKIKEEQNGAVSPEKFLSYFGIDIHTIKINPNQVFVITPLNSMYNETYEVIKKVCKSLELTAIRSDEEFIASNIMKYIIEKIVSSRIIIANVDGRNPNVMYELGIAHALNKPTIIIDQGNQLRPFDIQGNQIVIYDNLEDLTTKLKHQLISVVVSHS